MVWSTVGCLALASCVGGEATPELGGPRLAVDVAALNLVGVGDAVWDLEVDNAAGQIVWQKRVSSSGYGDGAGSASYVGTCDADSNDNTVKVWVVGVYDAPVTALGSFDSGAVNGATGVAVPFQNPTTSGPLTRTVTCSANEDVAVQFDVALMRPAQQGFFDIAVNFNNIFCSAKLDCCADTGDGVCQPSEDLKLLFDASGARARTIVLGFACTAGTAAGVDTALYMDPIGLNCGVAAAGSPDLTISPAGAPGNQCAAGAVSACDSVVAELNGVVADDYLYQVALYRGEEALTSGGDAAHKSYWNVALGVTASIGDCTLLTRATADDTADDLDGMAGGVVTAGAVYPYVSWNVPLATCAEEPLSFDGTGTVQTAYTGTGDGATPFAYAYAGGLPATPVCASPCLNGGTCTGPDVCTCAAGWEGAHCETLAATTACDILRQGGTTTSGYYDVDPDGAGPSGTINVWCDMTADGGGWTRVYLGGTNQSSLTIPYQSGTDAIVAAASEILFAYTDPADGSLTQAWKFDNTGTFDTTTPMAAATCGYVSINATRLSDGLTTTQLLRYGTASFSARCDESCVGTWGQICLKDNPTPGSVGGYLDFPLYASYAVTNVDSCSSSNGDYRDVNCSTTRQFAMLVR